VRDTSETAWWGKTRRLALAVVAGLGAICFVPELLSGLLDRRVILGLPFGTFLAVVVVPLVMLIAVFVFAARQQALDRGHDVAED
jgi:putative solute:sodium symporter small subunit